MGEVTGKGCASREKLYYEHCENHEMEGRIIIFLNIIILKRGFSTSRIYSMTVRLALNLKSRAIKGGSVKRCLISP